jgi:hypothetical protein
MGGAGGERWVRVSLADQRLELHEGTRVLAEWAVSTAVRGAGERHGSLQTPRGSHVVRARIGDGAPLGAVFVGRRPTGEVCTPERFRAEPDRDWILTRILWLSGTERGRNRMGLVDTMRRYIYIHGAPDELPMGVQGSHGCVRMRNADVLALFDQVAVGTRVEIEA